MKNQLTWLTGVKPDHGCDELVYPLDEAKKKFEVKELIPEEGWIVLDKTDEDWWKFAVFSFFGSDGNGENLEMSLIFHGEGPPTILRECRHTYWGEEGYLFYPNGPVIIAAFHFLSEFYDGMISQEAQKIRGGG